MPDSSARSDSALDREFRENRGAGLAAVNPRTFWAIAVILLSFSLWDAYVDPVNWPAAFRVRLIGVAVVVATGLFQNRPGRLRWMPLMAKVRFLTAVVTAAVAAAVLDRGYGFGVAGVVAMLLTGPYIAADRRDLLRMNAAALLALALVMAVFAREPFDFAGTVVFVLLAVAVSMLLGRVIEASHRRIFALEMELRREARTDTLTGLDNRRAIQERAAIDLERARRSGAPVSLALCDVDRFKNINDRHGHDTGDAVLRQAAAVLRGALRQTDALGRWGGEEFIAVLANTEARTAAEIAERMRAAIDAARFEGLPEGATISVGLATATAVSDVHGAWEDLLKDADRRLYRAKSEGRNRVAAD